MRTASRAHDRRPINGDTMSRARLAIGTFGEIGFLEAEHGRVIARARYRDWDGRTRLVQVTAETRALAERALKVKLSTRSLFQPSTSVLTPDSLFSHLVDYWLADVDQEGRLSTTTRQLYERNMRTLVMPALGNLTLREIGVARCDQLLKQLNKRSYSRAKHARVVLRLAFGLAVRHEVLPRNPMDHVARLHRKSSTPDALTSVEVTAIRTAIAVWEGGRAISGPKPDGQLGGIVEVMLGTSARIGEVLAIRRRDIEITSAVPSIRIAGTIVSNRGEPTTAGPSEDRQVAAHCGDPDVHGRGRSSAVGQSERSVARRTALLQQGGHSVDDQQRAPPAATSDGFRWHHRRHAARIPSHGRDRHQ